MPFGGRRRAPLVVGVVLAAAVAAFLASAGSAGGTQDTLVVDRSFEIRTADPQRAFEPTASIVNRAVYDTLLTFKGANVSRPALLAARATARRGTRGPTRSSCAATSASRTGRG